MKLIRMTFNRIIIAGIVSVLLYSCSNESPNDFPLGNFTKIHNVKSKLLNIDPFKLTSSGSMIMFEDEECLIKEESKSSYSLSKIYYNKDSVVHLATIGNGPNEFLRLILMNKKSRTSFLAIEVLKQKIYDISLDGKYTFKNKIDIFSNSVVSMNQRFYGQGVSSNIKITDSKWFIAFDSTGTIINQFGDFPDDKISSSTPNKHMAYQGKMIINERLNRFAFTSYNCAVLEVFESDSLIIARHDKLPQYFEVSGNNVIGVSFSPENIRGYMDSYSTDKFIYTLYSGKSTKDLTNRNFDDVSSSKIILVYDWDGNPICRINTDIDLRNICVNNDNTSLIGLACEKDYALCQFDLTNIIELQ